MSGKVGFIKIYRSLEEWGWYSDGVVKDVFLHCLIKAAYKDCEYMGQKLKAGQLVIGRKKLAEALGFGERQIRTALEKLQLSGEITVESSSKYSVITVVKWNEYQCCEGGEKEREATNDRPCEKACCDADFEPSSDQQATNDRPHSKEVKNIRNKESILYSAPTQPEEIEKYIRENSLNVNGRRFFDYYNKNGWKTRRGVPIKDWQLLLRVWSNSEKEREKAKPPPKYSYAAYDLELFEKMLDEDD